MVKQKPTKPIGVGQEDQEAGFEPVKKQGKKKGLSEEYPRTIKKIASYSGVTRTMRFNDKSGKFDEIINIYVYPDGVVDAEYNGNLADKYIGENSISKFNVRRHGDKAKSIWGRKEEESGYMPPEAAARHKKSSKPAKRIVRKHMAVPNGNSNKRK